MWAPGRLDSCGTYYLQGSWCPAPGIFAIYFDSAKDVVGGFGPHERLRIVIPVLDSSPDVVLQYDDGLVDSAADEPLGEQQP
jgi:hypothetical protein